ncbi:type IV toxin-antitoxin system AbiEi family antitoxin domain-containing protein [Agromyces sp. MMS24-JH15]|uniref:type IV toxin-antitoxin system AbiEi family antitoxin domain-containing protein n=1 Tax=Agromyces sp. MMS24-JH15 TaxID=3243765 RepID=UPI00374868CD
MEDLLAALGAVDHGIIRAEDLRRIGCPAATVARLVETGALVRVRRGVYVESRRWDASAEERHRIRVRAEQAQAVGDLVFSHGSAAAVHRLPFVGRGPATVHTVDPTATGGRRGRRRSVHRAGPPPRTETVDGVTVTSLSRTLADVALAEPWSSSVPMLDAALQRVHFGGPAGPGMVGRPGAHPAASAAVDRGAAVEALRAAVLADLAERRPMRGLRRAVAAVEFASPLAASPGESLSRVRIQELGFRPPELQVRIDGILGSFAEVDFLWRGIRHIGEFDGLLKYTRSREVSGTDPGSVVVREKLREDALRRQGYAVTRWEWATLRQPAVFAALLSEAGIPRA